MNQKAKRVLEYDKIIGLLGEQASSQMTKKVIEKLSPAVDMYQIKERLTETTEAVSVIMHKGALSLGGFYDISPWIHLASKGGSLTMKQLLQVLYNLQAARNAVSFLRSDLPPLPMISGLSSVLFLDRHLEDFIDRCILSEDEMADSASLKLAKTRRAILQQNDAIKAKMSSILSSQDNKTMLQDSIVTMRQGRFVIPVKSEHKSKFQGIVHDQSATGATLFIEPQAIVTMNNELRELELEEKKEMARILQELSSMVGQVSQELLNNQKLLVQLDFIFAKGKLAVLQKAMEPEMNEDGILFIRNGRHPLIKAKQVVPINVALGDTYHTLVVTGPNTGGKTVTLKTVGLFVMMAQSGLHLPASDGTRMPVFSKVFADIGDEQSIEQSLSTFSSHMNNIVELVREADDQTLVLLDELGAGTDPTEGAALAISILEALSGKGAEIMATTHYTELKKYALSAYGVENASMEFNVETLSPTYRLSIGVPGRSNAFEISKKLGLDESIINHAKNLLEQGDLAFEDVISTLEKDKIRAEEERDQAIALHLSMKRQQADLDYKQEKLEQKREKILSVAREEAKQMVGEAKELFDQIQKEQKELEKLTDPGERNRRQEKLRRELREKADKFREKLSQPENYLPPDPSTLKLGDRVRVLTLDQKGNIITLPDDKGDMQVQVGLLKISVNLQNVAKLQESTTKKERQKARYGALYRSKAETIAMSVNVVGMNLDEASMEVDKYLDDAFMAGLHSVSIIHGRGAGILREGLGQMLRHHKHVKDYRKGVYNEGGDGVTVVTLKTEG